jgi:hypothetical protein
MPLRHIENTDISYYLMLIDENGVERPEDGQLLSSVIEQAAHDGVTDVFILSHGWKGDVPAAISQYDRWIAKMAELTDDRALAHHKVPDFKTLIVGVHWPSLPWGDESAEAAVLGGDDDGLAGELKLKAPVLVARYAERIANTESAHQALETIVAAADDETVAAQIQSGTVPEDLDKAYRELFAQAGLATDGVASAPGTDVPAFSPADTAAEWIAALDPSAAPPADTPGVLGGGLLAKARDIVLSPVRQISFWTMKHRARVIGERDVHRLIRQLQTAAPKARFHLMGHSFGCIVVSAAVAGPVGEGVLTDRLPRPVETLFLVQGAMSLWSFTDKIPFPPNEPGYFHAVCGATRGVRGPLVTTLSSQDRAVGIFFPIGARLAGDRTLGRDKLPEYGGTGTFGVQGAQPFSALKIQPKDAQYGFQAGLVYNVDASSVICNGGGASGAHSDIAHDEVAHAFWQAAIATM